MTYCTRAAAAAALSLLFLSCRCRACSNFILSADDHVAVSGRTMDLGYWDGFSLVAQPPGSVAPLGNSSAAYPRNRLGFLSVYPSAGGGSKGLVKSSTAGMNTDGLTCDFQTLLGSKYPSCPSADDRRTAAVPIDRFCEWALGEFSDVRDLKGALEGGDHAAPPRAQVCGADALWENHYVLRDRSGQSLVVEFLGGETVLRLDSNNNGGDNDDDADGFGVFTNEPNFAWHLENVRHMEWKKTMARAAVAVPGGFYPDERYLRLHMLKQGLPAPQSYKEKVMQAVALLDSVTVPPGEQPATDSGEGEGQGDHTIFALVYDHGDAAAPDAAVAANAVAAAAAAAAGSNKQQQGEHEQEQQEQQQQQQQQQRQQRQRQQQQHRQQQRGGHLRGGRGPVLYWRTYADQSLQRVALEDLPGLYDADAAPAELPLVNDLPWFQDAAGAFSA